MNSHEVFIHIHQGCFAGTGAIVRLPQCQWRKPDWYGKISQCITTTKHSKAKTVCIFLGIYCSCLRGRYLILYYVRPLLYSERMLHALKFFLLRIAARYVHWIYVSLFRIVQWLMYHITHKVTLVHVFQIDECPDTNDILDRLERRAELYSVSWICHTTCAAFPDWIIEVFVYLRHISISCIRYMKHIVYVVYSEESKEMQDKVLYLSTSFDHTHRPSNHQINT